jgi:adenylylsulfate kinase-like enzyme
VHRSGRIQVRRLSDQAAYDVMVHRAKVAGVAACSPHDARRSFVSDLFEAGADVEVLRQLAGHSNVETTARYDRRGEAAKKKAGALHRLCGHQAEAPRLLEHTPHGRQVQVDRRRRQLTHLDQCCPHRLGVLVSQRGPVEMPRVRQVIIFYVTP